MADDQAPLFCTRIDPEKQKQRQQRTIFDLIFLHEFRTKTNVDEWTSNSKYR